MENRTIDYLSNAKDFFVLSGPMASRKRPGEPLTWDHGIKGRPFTAEEADKWVRLTYGGWVEKIFSQGKWAYRVRKPTARGGQYTPPANFPDRRKK